MGVEAKAAHRHGQASWPAMERGIFLTAQTAAEMLKA